MNTTLPLHPQAQPKRFTFRALVHSPSPLCLPTPCLLISSTYGKIILGPCTPQFSQTMARQQPMQSTLAWHTESVMGLTLAKSPQTLLLQPGCLKIATSCTFIYVEELPMSLAHPPRLMHTMWNYKGSMLY